ncbi:MAG: 30S ribosomal protein S17 [bacterium]|nr:30S ribosomal protein S17 [bacterium]
MITPATRPQSFIGVVVGRAGKDTTVVRVNRYVKHPKYKKYRVLSKKYLAHDEGNTASVGDRVTIVATRPISKMKRFRVAQVTRPTAASEE